MSIDSTTIGQDSELARRAQSGDRPALAELFGRHQQTVYGYFRARVLDRGAAEQLTQQTLLRVCSAIGDYRPAARFQNWLMNISREMLEEYVQRGGRRHAHAAWAKVCLDLEKRAPASNLCEEAMPLVEVGINGASQQAAEAVTDHYGDGPGGADAELLREARQALRQCISRHLGGGAV